MNQAELVLLLISLACISTLQKELKEGEQNYKEIKIGTSVEYDKSNNLFKFTYNGKASVIIFSFFEMQEALYLTYPNNTKQQIQRKTKEYEKYEKYVAELVVNGTYQIEIKCEYNSVICELGSKFSIYVPGFYQEIDFNEKMYINEIEYFTDTYYGLNQFKISNINEDKYIYFVTKEIEYYNIIDYYPYYPGEPAPDEKEINHWTVFEIINLKDSTKSKRNVKVYKFEKGTEYLINIHCYKSTSSENYMYLKYRFFPITSANTKKIKPDSGIITSKEPMIGIIDSKSG